MTDDERQSLINAGYEADRLRSDPYFGPAILELRREALDALASVEPTDVEAIRTHQATVRVVQGITDRIAASISRAQQVQKTKPVA